MPKLRLFLLLTAVFLIPLVLAGFNKGNPSDGLAVTYPIDSKMSGWVNMSFSDEASDSLFTGNYGGNITLKSLLDSRNLTYSCVPNDCMSQYTADSGTTTKEYNLDKNSKIISFKITGNFKEMSPNGIMIKFQGTNSDSCGNPLKIDILDDGTIEWASTNSSEDYSCKYESGYGCFNPNSELSDTEIEETPYCNKMKLPIGNSYELGAFVRAGSSAILYDEGLLNMELYDSEGDFLDSCTFDNPGPSSSGGEIACRVNYTNKQIGDFFLCISSGEPSSGYTTKYETQNSCGFFDSPPSQNYVADYQISARAAKYGSVGSANISNENYVSEGDFSSLEEYLNDYIERRYDSNCTSGCIIPVRISSDAQINFKILDASIKYKTAVGVLETKTVYDSVQNPSKMSTPYQKIDISSANFGVPGSYGNYTFKLSYKGSEIMSKNIQVIKIPVIRSIRPTATAAYQRTLFTASIANLEGNNTLSYSWDFGDDETAQTTNYSVFHVYTDIGNYTLTLTIKDSKGNTNTNSIPVSVQSPRDLINKTLYDYKNNLNKLKVQIGQMPAWQGTIIKEKLDLNNSEAAVAEIQTDYLAALTDNDEDAFLDIMSELFDLYIPQEIRAINSATGVPLIVDSGDIGNSELNEFTELEYPDSVNLGLAINAWTEGNLDASFDYKTLAGLSNGDYESLLTVYKIRVRPFEATDTAYLIIDGTDLSFASDYSQYEGSSFYGIKLDSLSGGMEEVIEFSTEPYDEPASLLFYIAPEPSKLDADILEGSEETISPCNFDQICQTELNEDATNCPSDCKNNTKLIISIIVVLLIGAAAYILMMWWYRNKYQEKIFKTDKDTVNILNYIARSKKSGMKEDKMKENLLKAGWTKEQIAFAFSKYKEDIKNN